MARASGVDLALRISDLPLLPGALACLEKGILNRAHKTNFDYVGEEISLEGLAEACRWLVVDPQTSGGLLLALPRASASEALARLRKVFPAAALVGEVLPAGGGKRILFQG
jgi:selenide,water dikinase